jgi:hypothetical protein
MILTCGFENNFRGGVLAKLIHAPWLTADRDKVRRAKATMKVSLVIELSPDRSS